MQKKQKKFGPTGFYCRGHDFWVMHCVEVKKKLQCGVYGYQKTQNFYADSKNINLPW
jgi:hypothetical protein